MHEVPAAAVLVPEAAVERGEQRPACRERDLARPSPGDRWLLYPRVERHGRAARVDPRQPCHDPRIARVRAVGGHEEGRHGQSREPRLGGVPHTLAREPRVHHGADRGRTVPAHAPQLARSRPADSDRRQADQRRPALRGSIDRIEEGLDLRDEAGAAVVAQPLHRPDREARVRSPRDGPHVGGHRQHEREDRRGGRDRHGPPAERGPHASARIAWRAVARAAPGAQRRPPQHPGSEEGEGHDAAESDARTQRQRDQGDERSGRGELDRRTASRAPTARPHACSRRDPGAAHRAQAGGRVSRGP